MTGPSGISTIITWTRKGIQCEADQRHAEIIIQELGLETAKSVDTPFAKDSSGVAKDVIWEDSAYRALAARSNYLGQDRPDTQYASTEVR